MDNIKEAFLRVREDMDFLKYEIDFLKEDLNRTRDELKKMNQLFVEFNKEIKTNRQTDTPTDTSTHKSQNPTLPTHPSTHNILLNPLKPQNMPISIGNKGVPTDRHTNRHLKVRIIKKIKRK